MIFSKKKIADLEAREAQVIKDMNFIAQEKVFYKNAEKILLERKIEVEQKNDKALILMQRAQADIEEARIIKIRCQKIIEREKQKRINTVNAHRRKLARASKA